MYGEITGLLIGAGVGGHALRVVVLSQDPIPNEKQKGRYALAICAMVFYSISAFLVHQEYMFGLIMSVIGPFLGLTTVLVFLKDKVDLFQRVLGVFQALPVLLAIGQIVINWHR